MERLFLGDSVIRVLESEWFFKFRDGSCILNLIMSNIR